MAEHTLQNTTSHEVSNDVQTSPQDTLLEVENLNVSFVQGKLRNDAVKNLNLHIEPQEIVGIVGESGSGKSVSMLGSMKLLPAHAQSTVDSILWRGTEIRDYSEIAMNDILGKEIAYIYQEPSQSYDPLMNIYASFREFMKAHSPDMTDDQILKKSVALLEEVGIANAEHRIKNYFHQFSGGMIQRVQIALALVHSPKLLIADEPTTALDVTTQKRVVDLLLMLCKQRHMAMVFITHDLALVSSIVDRILVMKDGCVVEEGTPNDILYYPSHEYTKQLLDTIIRWGDRHDH